MEYRAPSSLATTDGILRRRSGANAQHHEDDEDEDEPEDCDESGPLQRKPTVLLVRRAPPSPSLPAFPWLASASHSTSAASPFAARVSSAVEHVLEPEVERTFSPVPLTPRPDAQRADSDDASVRSLPPSHRPDGPHRAGSDASVQSAFPPLPTPDFTPLPTPDFTRPPRFLSLFPRGLSFFPYSRPQRAIFSRAPSSESEAESTSFDGTQHRPPSVRSDSQGSSASRVTDSSYASIDSGHHALIKGVGTTDRFTHKWPRPHSMRGIDRDDADAGLLEDGRGPAPETETWTGFKWCLLFSVCTVGAYGSAALVCALATWLRMWPQADVMSVADNDILVLITLAGALLVFAALVGLCGVFLDSRPLLAVYTLLLWPAFAALAAVGYVAYKRATFTLDHKLNLAWSQYYTPLGRLVVQESLRCCGYYSALHEATPSRRCFPRTALPGCKGKLYRFERAQLALVWSVAFSLVPLHLTNVLAALLCANHVTRTFGEGITPRRYRLTRGDVRADAEKIFGGVEAFEGVPLGRLMGHIAEGGEINRGDTDVGDKVPFLSYEGQKY